MVRRNMVKPLMPDPSGTLEVTAAALGIDYSAFNDLAGQVVEVTTAE